MHGAKIESYEQDDVVLSELDPGDELVFQWPSLEANPSFVVVAIAAEGDSSKHCVVSMASPTRQAGGILGGMRHCFKLAVADGVDVSKPARVFAVMPGSLEFIHGPVGSLTFRRVPGDKAAAARIVEILDVEYPNAELTVLPYWQHGGVELEKFAVSGRGGSGKSSELWQLEFMGAKYPIEAPSLELGQDFGSPEF